MIPMWRKIQERIVDSIIDSTGPSYYQGKDKYMKIAELEINTTLNIRNLILSEMYD